MASKKVNKFRVPYNPKLPLWLQPDDVDMSRTVEGDALELAQSAAEKVTFLQVEEPSSDLEVGQDAAENVSMAAASDARVRINVAGRQGFLDGTSNAQTVAPANGDSYLGDLDQQANVSKQADLVEEIEPDEALEVAIEADTIDTDTISKVSAHKVSAHKDAAHKDSAHKDAAHKDSAHKDTANVVSLRPDASVSDRTEDISITEEVETIDVALTAQDVESAIDVTFSAHTDGFEPDLVLENDENFNYDISSLEGAETGEIALEDADLDIPIPPSRYDAPNPNQKVDDLDIADDIHASDVRAGTSREIVAMSNEYSVSSADTVLPEATFLLNPTTTKRGGILGAIASVYRGFLSMVGNTLVFVIMLFAALCSGLLFGYLGFDLPF